MSNYSMTMVLREHDLNMRYFLFGETLEIQFMSMVSSLCRKENVWLKTPSQRNNFTVHTEVFPQGQA